MLLRGIPWLVLALLLIAQFTVASSARGLRADAPEAVIDITRRDLGEVFAGEELEYAFIVRNAGTKPLELKEKSTVSFRPANPRYEPSTAMLRGGDRLLTRTAAAMRAAPS